MGTAEGIERMIESKRKRKKAERKRHSGSYSVTSTKKGKTDQALFHQNVLFSF